MFLGGWVSSSKYQCKTRGDIYLFLKMAKKHLKMRVPGIPMRHIYIYMSYTYDIDHTFPEINSSHLKMDSWNTIISFWDGLFSGCHLSFRGCNILVLPSLPNIWQEGFWMTCLGWLWKTSDLWYFGDAKFSNEIRFGCWSLLSSLAKVELEVLQGSLNEVALDV